MRTTSLLPLLTFIGVGCSGASDTNEDVECPVGTDLAPYGERYEDMTLYAGCAYEIPYTLAFYESGATLTIEPGATIRFAPGAGLHVKQGARLDAQGAADAPITLSATDATAGWEGLSFIRDAAGAEPQVLSHVVLRQAGAYADPDAEDGGFSIYIQGDSVRLNDVTIEDGLNNGIRVFRESSEIASDSSGNRISVAEYPILADAQNLPSIPADTVMESADAGRTRVLTFAGNEGLIDDEDVVWPLLSVPIELGASISVSGGSLTIPAGTDLRIREGLSIRTNDDSGVGPGSLTAEGTPDAPIRVDWAEEGRYWGAFIFTDPFQSTIRHVEFQHGGTDSSTMLGVFGPGGPGSLGDCEAGPTIESNTFSNPYDGSYCLEATDHSNDYAASNTFVGCSAHVECD